MSVITYPRALFGRLATGDRFYTFTAEGAQTHADFQETFIAVNDDLPDALIEGFRFDGTLEGARGAEPSASGGITHAPAKAADGVVVGTSLSYTLALGSSVSPMLDVRLGEKPAGEKTLIKLNASGGQFLRLKWRAADERWVLEGQFRRRSRAGCAVGRGRHGIRRDLAEHRSARRRHRIAQASGAAQRLGAATMNGRWPALMLRETAAEYCDMSPMQFDRQCPVAPIDQGWRGLRWKRTELDAWIAALPVKPRVRKIGLDDANFAAANEPGSGIDEGAQGETPGLTPEERRAASLSRIGS
jgi:hypothetical protein